MRLKLKVGCSSFNHKINFFGENFFLRKLLRREEKISEAMKKLFFVKNLSELIERIREEKNCFRSVEAN